MGHKSHRPQQNKTFNDFEISESESDSDGENDEDISQIAEEIQ